MSENLALKKAESKENPWVNLIINVILPSVILTKLSAPDRLGQVVALALALGLPILYGAYDYFTRRKHNFLSIIGLISVLLTGGIGLFQLNKSWMIAKETIIPLIMGLAVYLSEYTKYPLLKTLLSQGLDLPKMRLVFEEHHAAARFDRLLKQASWGLFLSFIVSAILNYGLAVFILEGEPGSVQFNESLGKMTALSFPVITIPMMVFMGAIMFYLIKTIQQVTGQSIEAFILQK